MRELHERVIAQLKPRRESAGATALWERIWAAYEKGGAEGVDELLEALAERPDEDEEVAA